MKLEAKLYTRRGMWLTDSAYTFATNDPLVIFFGEEHAGETAQLSNGTSRDSIRIGEEGTIMVPPSLLGKGTLKITVREFIGERCVGEWFVDPLAIINDLDTITATPWAVSCEERIEALENALFGYSSHLFE
jgi:hypothetical protein